MIDVVTYMKRRYFGRKLEDAQEIRGEYQEDEELTIIDEGDTEWLTSKLQETIWLKD